MDEFGNAQAAMKMDGFFSNALAKSDPEVAAAIGDELVRQQDQIEMATSEARRVDDRPGGSRHPAPPGVPRIMYIPGEGDEQLSHSAQRSSA